MPAFAVDVEGIGLWLSIDDELQRVDFAVTRFVEAATADAAAREALDAVACDRRTAPEAGYAPPALTVGQVTEVPAIPATQPGFAFYPREG